MHQSIAAEGGKNKKKALLVARALSENYVYSVGQLCATKAAAPGPIILQYGQRGVGGSLLFRNSSME